MLVVNTILRPSGIHGIGVFADEYIRRGTTVWKYFKGFDYYLSNTFVSSLPLLARGVITRFCDHNSMGWLVVPDNARFFNHSGRANTIELPNHQGLLIASRDIAVGEEITEDYGDECDFHGLKRY